MHELRIRVTRLHQSVTDFADTSDLAHALHFGWFDRPYVRASLAVLIKTVTCLEQQTGQRGLEGSAVDDRTLAAMLEWGEAAAKRIAESARGSSFRPHRLRITTRELCTGRSMTPLFAFADSALKSRYDETFGDLDLLAAIGQRVYPRFSSELTDNEATPRIVARAAALAMPVLALSRNAPTGDTKQELRSEPQQTGLVSGWPVTLRTWLLNKAALGEGSSHVLLLVDSPNGEGWAASLARRRLAHGQRRGGGYAVVGWTPPVVKPGQERASTVTAMWIHVVEGQLLGVLTGWSDIGNQRLGDAQSLLVDPATVEVIAHTALDIIRLRQYLLPLWSNPPLAIAVGVDALDPADANTWASWIEPVWERLLTRQIRFDVIPVTADHSELRSRYRIVFPLSRNDLALREADATIDRVERLLAVHADHTRRVTVRETDGRIAADVYVNDAETLTGRRCVAVANLSGRTRKVSLRGGPPLGKVRDVIADEYIPRPGDSLTLRPWQMRLLWPAEDE